MTLKRWDYYNSNDRDIYIIKGQSHDIKALFERAMTRLDSEGGLWFSGLYEKGPNNWTMSELVSMAEDYYTNLGLSSTLWEMLGYKKASGGKVRSLDKTDFLEAEEGQNKRIKEEPEDVQVKEEPEDVQVKEEPEAVQVQVKERKSLKRALPTWMTCQYDIAGKTMSGLEMFTLASVIVDSNGTNWHCTNVEFATLNPSPVYLTEHQTHAIALRNRLLNGQSPEMLSKVIKEWDYR